MNLWHGPVPDPMVIGVLAATLLGVALATFIGQILKRRVKGQTAMATVENLNLRLLAWWPMVLVFGIALTAGETICLILFALLSLLALREYITIVPTRRADHRALFWSFFLVMPIQYLLIAMHWYGMFAIFIPVWAFLFLPLRIALAGDTENFLERAAKMQWGLMLCVYCLSHAPALLILTSGGARLLLYLAIVDQSSDVFQYCWGKLAGRHRIVPQVSPNKTVEGTIGGGLSAIALGVALRVLTPFSVTAAALLSLVIVVAGFAGGLAMSAIKRDRGIKDYGAIIPGHGGVLDRIDSLCFAAPAFFHLVRYYYG